MQQQSGDLSPQYFYPRSPCGERLAAGIWPVRLIKFLSTLSLRRATSLLRLIVSYALYFYPRSPCGERRLFYRLNAGCLNIISIHALLAESDAISPFLAGITGLFLSTLSLRRATHICSNDPGQCQNFYPRSPCGERLMLSCSVFTACAISIHALLAESDLFVHAVR